MPRVKRGKSHLKRRRKLLKQAKGYQHKRKSSVKLARTATLKAGAFAYRDRKAKKRTARRLWQVKLNAAVRQYDLSYSQFINLLKKKKVDLDRKVLADLAENNPKIFKKIIEAVK